MTSWLSTAGTFRDVSPAAPHSDHVLTEVKGGEILQMARSDSRNRRRQATLLRNALLDLVDAYDAKIIGRVWVKESGKALKPDSTYLLCRSGHSTAFQPIPA